VLKHRTKETGIWVTYQGSVYDITNFAESHPGPLHGSHVLLGTPVE
jgi:cytochrome b involved in lipid metabolism